MGIPLYNYYGLTETTGICIAEPLHQAAFEDNSIGVPVDSLVKVADEAGNPVPAGTPGELCIYGAGVFQGYFKNATATKAVLNNGWFRTGDVVVQNEKGWLYLHGRLSDIVKLPSGERIEVRAVDDVLESIAGLNDWAVCPLRDWERESIALFIVPEPTVDHEALVKQIRHALKEHIGAFALPALIEPVSFIPRGNHHKVLRHQLTETYFQTVKQA